MDTQNTRKYSEPVALPADDSPSRSEKGEGLIIDLDPPRRVQSDHSAAVIEWEEPDAIVIPDRSDAIPWVDIKRRDEVAVAVRHYATRGGEFVAIVAYFTAVSVFAVVKYSVIAVASFVIEIVRVVFRLSTAKKPVVMGDDMTGMQSATKGAVNVTTNVVGNVSGNVTVNNINIHA